MQRREFMKAGLLGGVGLVSRTWPCFGGRSNHQGVSERREILVIGAGMAGLAAAQELRQLGHSVKILEARTRIGGRVWAENMKGQPIDLGAQWLEGMRGNPITKLAAQNDIEVVETDYEDARTFDELGRVYQDQTAIPIFGRINRLMRQLAEVGQQRAEEGLPDTDVASVLRELKYDAGLDPRARNYLNWVLSWSVGGVEAENLEDVSLEVLLAEREMEGFGGGYGLFPKAYGQIPHLLIKDLDILTDCVVEAIDTSGARVRVTSSRGEHEADALIVTVPLGVLKAGRIEFTPQLPEEKRAAIATVGMGVAHKVVLRFADSFWPKKTDYFAVAMAQRDKFVEWLNYETFAGAPILSIWSHGDVARQLETQSQEAIVREVMALIRAAWGKEAPDPIAVRTSNWGRDPFALGSYSNLPPGAEHAHLEVLAQPVGDKLFFAGEATQAEHRGTVHGAYLSGIREARRIHQLAQEG